MRASESNSSRLRHASGEEVVFSEIVQLIRSSQEGALRAVNTLLIDLYWKVGEIISGKIASAEWGDGWCRD